MGKKFLKTGDFFFQELCFVIVYLIFSVKRICHSIHDHKQGHLHLLEHTDRVRFIDHRLDKTQIAIQFIKVPKQPNAVIRL